jgi:beta-galactosidase
VAEVWLNGAPVGGHEGGEMPFALDVTEALIAGENLLAVQMLNPTDEPIDGIHRLHRFHRLKISKSA